MFLLIDNIRIDTCTVPYIVLYSGLEIKIHKFNVRYPCDRELKAGFSPRGSCPWPAPHTTIYVVVS